MLLRNLKFLKMLIGVRKSNIKRPMVINICHVATHTSQRWWSNKRPGAWSGLDWTGLNGHTPCPSLSPEDRSAEESLEFNLKLSFLRAEIWLKSHTVKGQDTANKWYWSVMHVAQKSLKIIVRFNCMTFQKPQNQDTSLHLWMPDHSVSTPACLVKLISCISVIPSWGFSVFVWFMIPFFHYS